MVRTDSAGDTKSGTASDRRQLACLPHDHARSLNAVKFSVPFWSQQESGIFMRQSASLALGLASSAASRGELWAAAQHLRQALASGDRLGQRWIDAVRIAEQIADDHGAVLSAQRLCDESSNGPAESFILAEAFTLVGRADEAVELLIPLADRGRLSPDQCFKLTRMLMFAGRLDESQSRCRSMLASHPDSPTLWERIAQTKRFTLRDRDIAEMRKVFDRWTITRPSGRAAIATALAKAYVDLGEDRLAHECLEARAAANRARFPFDPRPLEVGLRDVLTWCESGEEDTPTADKDGSQRPIFILGPMRSGTSLLDQIFSRHSAIQGGGELKHFWLASRELGDCSSARISAFSGPWSEFGRRYLALADERFGTGTRFTDKLLSNVYRVRAIRRSLPEAHIIYINRNPLDVAWSCWRAQFDAESAWSNSPESIALYIASFRRIMEAWMKRYPDSIAEVSYENLVRDPDLEIPRLLRACGLTDDPATRQPQLSERSVITMSFAQVRAPINTGSIDSAASFPVATRKLRVALEAAELSR
jgi:thioredoxin-like negative regulator of GroEL